MMCCGPSLFATAAFILSIVANSRCYLFKVNTAESDLPYEPQSIGLWCFESTNGVNYDTRDFTGDEKFEAARALGTATLILGLIIWIFFLIAGCCRFGPKVFLGVGFLCFCNTIFQGLVFLVKKSEVCFEGCDLDTGGKCAISATVLWFVASLLCCASGKKADDSDQDAGAGEQQQQQQDKELEAEDQPKEEPKEEAVGE